MNAKLSLLKILRNQLSVSLNDSFVFYLFGITVLPYAEADP